MKLRPMTDAKKDGSTIWGGLRSDLSEWKGRADLQGWDGVQVPVRHPGLLDDDFDMGWNIAAPVGHGGFPDDWFAGWVPLLAIDADGNVHNQGLAVAENDLWTARLAEQEPLFDIKLLSGCFEHWKAFDKARWAMHERYKDSPEVLAALIDLFPTGNGPLERATRRVLEVNQVNLRGA